MDGIYGCGCKEVYRFPHITYPSIPLVSVLFCSLMFFFLVQVLLVM